MVAADHDRRLQRAVGDHLVEPLARPVAFAVAEPADPGGQALELDALAGQLDPAGQRLVLREEVEDGAVGVVDVGGVAGQRRPAEGALALAEQRADVGRDEAGEGEGPLVAGELRLAADGVAVVEDLGAGVLEADHRLHVPGHRLAGALGEFSGLGGGVFGHVGVLDAEREVGQRVVGRRLVGDDVDGRPHGEQLRHQLGRVAQDADGQRAAGVAGLGGQPQRVVEGVGAHVEVAVLDPAFDGPRVDVDAEGHAAVHGDGERLGAAHAAEPGGQGDRAGQRAVEALGGDRGEGLVGALQDALGADVDPRARGHLAVHRQAKRFEAAELLPGGPVADQVGVGDQHAGRPLVGLHDADRAAGLDEHRLVLLQAAQGADHRVEGVPVAGGLAGAAVDDELVGVLGHLGVEVVLQHAQRGFLLPAQGAQFRTARRAYRPRSRHRCGLLVMALDIHILAS